MIRKFKVKILSSIQSSIQRRKLAGRKNWHSLKSRRKRANPIRKSAHIVAVFSWDKVSWSTRRMTVSITASLYRKLKASSSASSANPWKTLGWRCCSTNTPITASNWKKMASLKRKFRLRLRRRPIKKKVAVCRRNWQNLNEEQIWGKETRKRTENKAKLNWKLD